MAKRQNLDFNSLLPTTLKNETLSGVVSNLFNRFVSEEKSIVIDGRIGKKVAGDSNIKPSSLNAELNSLVPALYFKNGVEEQAFTFDDFVNRLNVLSADTPKLHDWMVEQHFNYSPPVDYDKFINFANYYWVKDASKVAPPSWNLLLDPEYYVIAKPAPTDTIKLPVDLATTRNVNLYINDRAPEQFKINFLNANTFEVTNVSGTQTFVASTNTLSSLIQGEITKVSVSAVDSNVAPGLSDADALPDQLFSFSITNGPINFAAGDYFTLSIAYFTSNIQIFLTSANLTGKGMMSGVQTTSPYMFIDGVQLTGGERVLVLNQNDPIENGIYKVMVNQKWIRTDDAATGIHFPANTHIYVESGASLVGHTFVLSVTATVGTAPLVFTDGGTALKKQINNWQEFNFWYHKDELSNPAFVGIDMNAIVQATRPIIEINNKIQLNQFIDSFGNPIDGAHPSAIPLDQVKTRFNQIPQFDLYRYDGTHHLATSGLFFYVEDPDYTTDAILKKRVKLTADYDYVFGHGMSDDSGRLLFYKEASELKSIWRAGVSSPEHSDIKFIGKGNGVLSINSLDNVPDNQDWTITALSATEFSVSGSRSGLVGNATVGTLFACDDLTLTISAGSTPFEIFDNFTFTVNAPISPRYVKKISGTDTVINYPGGYAADWSQEGTWLTPLRMFQNLERETRMEINFGDFLNHARSVIRHQNGFAGTSYGNNNVRHLPFNPGLGGTIREFSSNFPLLASMLIQKDLSPLTIIDFAEAQYNTALSSIDQFLTNELATYIASNSTITTQTIDPGAADILALESYFEKIRGADENLKTVFSDTTAKVTNWPVTLPMIGLLPKVLPTARFEADLGINVVVHHDGHISPLIHYDKEFDRRLVQTAVTRSDGSVSPGVFSESMPAQPYANLLWIKPSTFELKVFHVNGDSDVMLPGEAGDFWYQRSTDQMKAWDTVGGVWTSTAVTKASRWITLSTASIRNSLVLAVEQKLYNSVHPMQEIHIDLNSVVGSGYAEIELARYAAKYNYDTFAPDYIATNAFTWNYSSATLPELASVPPRWYNIYKAYFAAFGAIGTSSPHVEPWKLGTNLFPAQITKPAGWDAAYACTNPGSTNVTVPVKAVITNSIALPLMGLLVQADGEVLSNGDRVLLVGQINSQFNGIYIASSGGWSRSADVLTNQITIPVVSGTIYKNTVWSLTTVNPVVTGTTPLTFEQVRMWKSSMWADIKAHTPGMKLGVNVNNDTLLPPYVSPLVHEATEALFNTIPASAANGYSFGQGSPVETVWKNSLEYAYGLARSYFRLSPLEFLDKTWGETYFTIGNNVRLERNLMRSLPSAKFLMHGEKLNIVNSYSAQETQNRIELASGASFITSAGPGKIAFEVTYCGNNTTMFYVSVNDTLVGMIHENEVFSIPATFGIQATDIRINDKGIPFEFGEQIVIVFDATGAASYRHIPASTKKFFGLGQLFTNLLRFSYIDTDISLPTLAYRGWGLKLAHKIGSLMRPDSLIINTAQGKLPPTAFNVVLKRSTGTQSIWTSALRVQLVRMGAKTISPEGTYTPIGEGTDWVFRISTYNPQHPLAEYYSFDTSSDYQTFHALQKQRTSIAWKQYTTKVGLQQTTMPVTIQGIQNVVNFMFGYADRLSDLGWKINADDSSTTDAETGRNLDWQLEIEKYIDRLYGGQNTGDGHILNPTMQKLNLLTPIGLMSRYTESNFIDAYSTQAVFDVVGQVIPPNRLTVIRQDENTITRSSTPIFSAHVFIDEFEHAILFNKKFSDENVSATIFDPFLGLHTDTAYLSFVRQDATNLKPTFDGFFLDGNNVSRNIVSSIDNIGNYYDASQTFSEEKTARHSMALLGFNDKSYFNKINVNDTTQFNFWRGLVQAKGTNMTIDAFVNYKKFQDASVDEYWAYRVASYGDARERSFPEVKINPSDVTQKFARLQFYSVDNATYSPLPLYTQIENADDTRWYSIDDLGKGMKFEAQQISEVVAVPTDAFAPYAKLKNIYHNGDSKSLQIKMVQEVYNPGGMIVSRVVSDNAKCTVINAQLVKITGAADLPSLATWPLGYTNKAYYEVTGYTWINPTKLSPIKLFDYSQDTLIAEIGLWHPAIGIHAAAPLEIVNIISPENPALYTFSQTVVNPNYRHLKPWAEKEVGKVWWDTNNLGYIPYYDAAPTVFPNRDARHSRWGGLAEWASVDLYQWTKSNVHPSLYDALAASEEGNSEIDKHNRASGKIAFKKNYSRKRIIKTRPVSWSYVPSGNADAHPAFGPSETKVFVAGNVLTVDTGRVADSNLVSGQSFGGWLNDKPVGEALIGSTLSYNIGSIENGLSTPKILSNNTNLIKTIEIKEIDNGIFGTRIGKIELKKKDNNYSIFYLRMVDSTGFFEDVYLEDWFNNLTDATVDPTKTFEFITFGLKVVVTRNPASLGFITAEELANAITSKTHDIFIRESVNFTELIPLPDVVFDNGGLPPPYGTEQYGWRSWPVPAQAVLNGDLVSPNNCWQPYLGAEDTVPASAAVIAAMNDSSSKLSLKNGITINRFTSDWTEWQSLDPIKQTKISNGVDILTFDIGETIDVNRFSLYTNGIQMNPLGYTISGKVVTLLGKLPEGTEVRVLHRAYQPTAADLAFDPAVKDDITIQVQFKQDYEYTEFQTRDSEGNVTGSVYYFWVQDKSIPQANTSMSVLQAKNLLKNGPGAYTIFSQLVSSPTATDLTAAAYDSCAIAGIGYLVSKNDAFKLRFLRNFTLRDDPEEIKLKNVHAEWALLRKTQSSKIPKSLWDYITDAVSGEDLGGNPLPSQFRVDYDSRNGTRTRFGTQPGQIFAETGLVKTTITNTVLNTKLLLNLGYRVVPDYITALDFSKSDTWFDTPEHARITMNKIWNTARPHQINEIFFDVLEDALANNFEFKDIFKTSYISVGCTVDVSETIQQEQVDEFY